MTALLVTDIIRYSFACRRIWGPYMEDEIKEIADSVKLWQIIRAINMTVSSKNLSWAINNYYVFSHTREFKKHLINIGITVASYCKDLVCQSIKSLYDLHRIQAFRYSIARSVIDDVA